MVAISIIQYFAQKRMHQRAKNYFVQNGRKFRQEVKIIAAERYQQLNGRQSTNSLSGKKFRAAKLREKEALTKIEADVANELSESIVIEGGYQAPKLENLFIFKLIRFPVVLPVIFYRKLISWYQHSFLGKELSLDEQKRLTASTLDLTWDGLIAKLGEEEAAEALRHKIYDSTANLKKYQQALFMRQKPGQYKKYKRWKKKQG